MCKDTQPIGGGFGPATSSGLADAAAQQDRGFRLRLDEKIRQLNQTGKVSEDLARKLRALQDILPARWETLPQAPDVMDLITVLTDMHLKMFAMNSRF